MTESKNNERHLSTALPGKFQEVGSGLLIRDVLLLAEGTWTDSAVGQPLTYPAQVLEKFAKEWADDAVWSRHAGGLPRNITDKIGVVQSPRYRDAGVRGDIFLHGVTQESRDTAELIKAGLVDSVSVEVATVDKYDPKTRQYVAEALKFHGLAIVNRGACKKCKIQEQAQPTGHHLAGVADLEDPPAVFVDTKAGTVRGYPPLITTLEEREDPAGVVDLEDPPAVFVDTRTGTVRELARLL